MPTYRLQFDVSENAFQEFEKLRTDLGLKRQDVFRAAIRYLQWTWERVNSGEEIYVGKDQVANKVNLPYIQAKR